MTVVGLLVALCADDSVSKHAGGVRACGCVGEGMLLLFIFSKTYKIPWLVVVADLDGMRTVVEKEEHNWFYLKLRD